ncbi:hypothetical protein IHE44_0014681 [Lamprotornis superbus]|uniref:Ermin n=1 Tax=Lamprotornis superbus TaxID=245042 RepID=A0A835TSN6_9PASS|nr:hypothetical protein IHE44_0014681 [Lamprotornis superbus]
MTEEVPAAATMPACNGSLPPGHGPLQITGGIEEIPKSVGTVPYANADTSPDTSPAKESPEETRNSLAEDITPESFAGQKRCQEKREENVETLQQGAADTQDTGTNGQGSGEGNARRHLMWGFPGPGGTAGTGTETLPGSAEPRGNAEEAEEAEEEEEEEQDTEEDEVQVIEIKKEKSEGSGRQQPDKQASSPGSPERNSPLGKAGELPGLGKKNDISRHSYSRYNTISYRRIRKGNTKQRIDEFESMMHL